MGEGKTPEHWDDWTGRMKAAHGNGNGHGKSLAIEAQRLLKTPTAQLAINGGSQHPDKRKSGGHGPTLADEVEHLLPTPTCQTATGTDDFNLWSLAPRLLPTPTAMDHKASGGGYNGQTNVTLTDATVRQPDRWGDYGPAIRRWEAVLGRPAPSPTDPGKDGRPRLSPHFVEWMQGLPVGHVTAPEIGLSLAQQLKALGNGVVPQQAALALRLLLGAR